MMSPKCDMKADIGIHCPVPPVVKERGGEGDSDMPGNFRNDPLTIWSESSILHSYISLFVARPHGKALSCNGAFSIILSLPCRPPAKTFPTAWRGALFHERRLSFAQPSCVNTHLGGRGRGQGQQIELAAAAGTTAGHACEDGTKCGHIPPR